MIENLGTPSAKIGTTFVRPRNFASSPVSAALATAQPQPSRQAMLVLPRSWFHQSLDRVHRQHQPERVRQAHETVSLIESSSTLIHRINHQHRQSARSQASRLSPLSAPRATRATCPHAARAAGYSRGGVQERQTKQVEPGANVASGPCAIMERCAAPAASAAARRSAVANRLLIFWNFALYMANAYYIGLVLPD